MGAAGFKIFTIVRLATSEGSVCRSLAAARADPERKVGVLIRLCLTDRLTMCRFLVVTQQRLRGDREGFAGVGHEEAPGRRGVHF